MSSLLFIVVIALINPTLGFFIAIIGLLGDKKNWKICIFCISLFFANAAYCYTPESSSPDLYRYFEYVFSLKDYSLFDTLTNGYQGTTLYSFNFMVWISNACNDVHLLPAMSVFFVYYIALYCTCRVGVQENIKWRTVFSVIAFQLLTLDWYALSNNVRNVLAFTIIGYAVFRDIYLQKKDIFMAICYLVPVFIHPTSIIFVVVRIALLFTQKTSMKYLLIGSTLLVNPLVDFLHSVMYNITSNQYILLVITKAYNYLFDNSTAYGLAVKESIRSNLTRAFYLSLIAIMVIFFIQKIQLEKKINVKCLTEQGDNFLTFVLVVCMLALACTFMLRPEYWRFAATAMVFSSIMIMPLFHYAEKNSISRLIKVTTILLSFGCFVLWIYQLTWFDSLEMVKNAIINCPLLVMAKAFTAFYGGL